MIVAEAAAAVGALPAFDEARILVRINVDWFFDRDRVQRLIDRNTAKGLNRTGKIVRDQIRKGIRRMGAARTRQLTSARGRERQAEEARLRPPSAPGTPPNTHTGFFRQNVAYAFDPFRRSVVIGALRAHWLYDLHEFGGRHPRLPGRQYPARPAMEIGLRRALPYIPDQFANLIDLYQ